MFELHMLFQNVYLTYLKQRQIFLTMKCDRVCCPLVNIYFFGISILCEKQNGSANQYS